MNEIDLIIRRLEMIGGPVEDVVYHSEACIAVATGFQYQLGFRDKIPFGKCWFFGNVNLRTRIGGVVVLTNENILNVIFSSTMAGEDIGVLHCEVGVNHGLNLIGTGEYAGLKKIYQLGFNWIAINTSGFGVATFTMVVEFNGFCFKLK